MTQETADVKYHGERPELLAFVPDSVRTVLDVGCGGGGFGQMLKTAHPDIKVWGVDSDPVAAAAAEKVAGYERVPVGFFPNAGQALGDVAFDLIAFNDVLEHMPEPAKALEGAHRLLAPGGMLLASIPNVRHVGAWWPLVRRGRWDYSDYGILDRTHLQFFTRATTVELFEKCGWFVERVTGINKAIQQPFGRNSRKTVLLSRATLGRLDDFLWVQYVVQARAVRAD